MKIAKLSRVLIKYQTGRIVEGKVLNTQGDCVEIQTTKFKFGPIRIYVNKWYSFDNQNYKLVVEQVAS